MIPHRSRGRVNSTLLIILAAAVAGVAGVWLGSVTRAPEPLVALKSYPTPRPIAEFNLIDSRGEVFSTEQLAGQWDLLFFGFTNCPDVCPATLTQLAALNEQLNQVGAAPPRVTLISVDPERDEPSRMGEYVRYFDPTFRAATGSHAALAAFTRQMGVAYHVEDHEPNAAWYNVDHSASILVVDPDANLVGLFSQPLNLDQLTADLTVLMQ